MCWAAVGGCEVAPGSGGRCEMWRKVEPCWLIRHRCSCSPEWAHLWASCSEGSERLLWRRSVSESESLGRDQVGSSGPTLISFNNNRKLRCEETRDSFSTSLSGFLSASSELEMKSVCEGGVSEPSSGCSWTLILPLQSSIKWLTRFFTVW